MLDARLNTGGECSPGPIADAAGMGSAARDVEIAGGDDMIGEAADRDVRGLGPTVQQLERLTGR